jgi:hypothetical protein
MCSVGEKGMLAIPISKTDQRFFRFKLRGSKEGYELVELFVHHYDCPTLFEKKLKIL